MQQSALDAGQAEQRQENQQDDNRCIDNRALHFAGRLGDDFEPGLRRCARFVQPQTADDILNHNDRIIDQHTQGNGEAAQRHGIDRAADQVDRNDRRDNRHRNCRQRDQSRAPRGKEQEHDDRNEDQPLDQRRLHIANRAFDKIRLPENLGFKHHPLGQ